MVCERCRKKATEFSCSFFNTQMCCKECLDKESKHPLYKCAKEEELKHVKNGNYKFEGIGLPKDLE